MSVEQYFGGRIRYIQVGDNGNAAPGIGCYAKSRGVSGQDESEIRRRYTQYLNTQKNMKGKCPTIYKRAILPTGTILQTACSYIPALRGSRGNVIDRPDWIDHTYLIRGNDPEALDPERWLGLPYRTDDPNPTWEVMPEEVKEKISGGEVYKTDRWIEAKSLPGLPKSAFRLMPLSDVMEMWNLNEIKMINLIEAVMDCVAAPDQGGRKLFIKYDLNAADCKGSRFWDASMDEEEFNRFRMEHLLCWIYHLIPFSFRRLLGYDTIMDVNAGYHHIIFVTADKIGIAGNQYVYMFPGFDGSRFEDNKNMMQTGYGYLFDPSHGLWHNAAGGQKYAELFRTEGIIQKLIAEEVRAYMNAGSMKEIRGIIKEYCEFFKLLERHLPIYSNSIEELESDIPRWKASLVSDSKELRGMALTNLKRTGGEDIAVNAENYEYFLQVITTLKRRTTKENRESLWTPVVEGALLRPAFKDQQGFVKELAEVILGDPNPLERYKKYAARNDFRSARAGGESVLKQLFAELLSDEAFVKSWLSEQYAKTDTYVARLRAYDATAGAIDELSMGAGRDAAHAANDRYYESLEPLTDVLNTEILFTIPPEKVRPATFDMAEKTAEKLVAAYPTLDICKEVARKGPDALTSFKEKCQNSKLKSYPVLTDRLMDTVFGEWAASFSGTRIPPQQLAKAVDLVCANSSDPRAEDWSGKLTKLAADRRAFDEFTTDDFRAYCSAVSGTDPMMLRIVIRYYMCNLAVRSISEGSVVSGRDDIRILSEYLTQERKYIGSCPHPDWLEGKISEGTQKLAEIIAGQMRADGSYDQTAALFDSIRDDENVLNSKVMLDNLLSASEEITDNLPEDVSEELLHTFERAFKWWGNSPEVRAQRRSIVRASNYRPSFNQISRVLDQTTPRALERLSDDGFIYDCERYNIRSREDLLQAMSRKPSKMTKKEWISCYCEWIEEAFRDRNFGAADADYLLLDTLCKVVSEIGFTDIGKDAAVDQKWLLSLPQGNVRGDRVKKSRVKADNLLDFLEVIEICGQLSSAKAKKVNTADRVINKLVCSLIESGKLYVNYNDRTMSALTAYIEEDSGLFEKLLLEQRLDKTLRLIRYMSANTGNRTMTRIRETCRRFEGTLKTLYIEEDIMALREALEADDGKRR